MQEQNIKPRKCQKQKHPAIIYLNRYRALELRRDDLKAELIEIRQNATRATSRMTAERFSGTGKKDGMANAAVKAVLVENRLENTITHLQEALDFRLWLIEQLTDEWEKTILTERYVSCRRWDDILERIPYERTRMHEIHGNALNNVWAIYQHWNSQSGQKDEKSLYFPKERTKTD